MTVEVRPFGARCNLHCHYCYQNSERDSGSPAGAYDSHAVKSSLAVINKRFALFGGEALLLPAHDLEDLWSFGLDKWGSNGIQTNGSLITERHIELFLRYKVHVGISIDGPDELNDVRWAGSREATRLATAATERAIRRLCEVGISPGLIVTLHRKNAIHPHLARLKNWFLDIERLGVRSCRLHVLEVETPAIRRAFALTNEENIAALLELAQFERRLTTLSFDLFAEVRSLLMGRDEKVSCVWGGCDQYDTQAVQGVEGSGEASNCGRVNKDGVNFVKAGTPGFERYLSLRQTPQSHGGCAGCRFFVMCKGQCPGTATDADWRNRSEYCEVWKELFAFFEQELIAAGTPPLSQRPDELRALEERFVAAWRAGRNSTISMLLRKTVNPGKPPSQTTAQAADGHR